jgi:hypothetical protein
MKKHTLILLFLAFVILFSTKAFALVDAAFVGGYTFEGKIKIGDEYFRDITGYQFGFFAHLNVNSDIFLLGFGVAYQQGAFQYEAHDEDQEFIIHSSSGPDFIFMLYESSTTRPYGRLGFSFIDNLKYDYGEEYKDKIRFLNSGWFALGVGQVVVPSVIIFAEFQRYATRMNSDHSISRYLANIGVMFVY